MKMLKAGDYVGLCGCSDGQSPRAGLQNEALVKELSAMGLKVVESPCLYRKNGFFSGTGRERAEALMSLFRDPSVKAIFDLSGGDIANQILEYLDYSEIRLSAKPLFGYSDLTTVLNAVCQRSGIPTYLYQVRNLVLEDGERQRGDFCRSLLGGENDLFQVKWDFICGERMDGVVAGGNYRCLMKLAGTPYMPDLRGKLLFLESNGGTGAKFLAELVRMRQMGILEKLGGILLGTFTRMEDRGEVHDAAGLVRLVLEDLKIPIAKTSRLGHGPDSRCLVLGTNLTIERGDCQNDSESCV